MVLTKDSVVVVATDRLEAEAMAATRIAMMVVLGNKLISVMMMVMVVAEENRCRRADCGNQVDSHQHHCIYSTT